LLLLTRSNPGCRAGGPATINIHYLQEKEEGMLNSLLLMPIEKKNSSKGTAIASIAKATEARKIAATQDMNSENHRFHE